MTETLPCNSDTVLDCESETLELLKLILVLLGFQLLQGVVNIMFFVRFLAAHILQHGIPVLQVWQETVTSSSLLSRHYLF